MDTKLFLDSKSFLFHQIFFQHLMFRTQIFFWPNNFCWSKIVLIQKKFWSHNFLFCLGKPHFKSKPIEEHYIYCGIHPPPPTKIVLKGTKHTNFFHLKVCYLFLILIRRRGGGQNISTAYYSGTKSWIDLIPGCKFQLVCRQKVYVKNDQFEPWKDPGGPFFTKGPLKSASQGPFRGPFGCPWRSRRVPWALAKYQNNQKSVP